ncbi:hypothetical protein [Desulfitobacterium sp.]|uniref:hypothetical protein n=1 Tax=Desulfitobacterium sp. TaxID=49981 RepID=UPI002BF570FE|nr:hypothetical protein [Desulfitobacterium sp.]HVJ48009.1 hypothetical protein [Desulfitobacterium sp.]
MSSRNFRLFIVMVVLFIIINLLIVVAASNSMVVNKQQKEHPPLLLNSGLTDVSEAEAQVILWFDGQDSASHSEFINNQVLSQAGWEWESHDSQKALTVSGYRRLKASDEAEILTWFEAVAQMVEQEGGKAYFDERIDARVDGMVYLRQNGFEPKQGVITGTTASIAGWQEGFFPVVQAGRDSVNIQLLTRSASQGAKTVLAIPVLLEEF